MGWEVLLVIQMGGSSEQLINGGSSSSPIKRFGITKPISLAGPTEADLLRNAELGKVFFFVC